jgi:hypothetical protein
MKICIIGFPRSRSSILLETLSFYYNIPVLGEDINETINSLNKIDKFNRSYQYQLEQLLPLIVKNNKQQNGILRYHPLQFALFCWENITDNRTTFNMIDFELFDFDHFDKIYFTSRESIADSIASVFIAEETDGYTHRSKENLYAGAPLTITRDHFRFVNSHIFSELIVNDLKEYLKGKNITWEELFYNDIPRYLQKNFPGVSSTHVETNYDYSVLIDNYIDIIKFYDEYKEPTVERYIKGKIGVSSNGRTADFDSVNRGSSPCTPAKLNIR